MFFAFCFSIVYCFISVVSRFCATNKKEIKNLFIIYAVSNIFSFIFFCGLSRTESIFRLNLLSIFCFIYIFTSVCMCVCVFDCFFVQSCRLVSGFVVSFPLDPLRITGNSDALHNFICLYTLTSWVCGLDCQSCCECLWNADYKFEILYLWMYLSI